MFRRKIRNGQIPPGGKPPSHDQVRADFGVSLGTVKHAYAVPRKEGLIVTHQGQSAYVRTQPEASVVPTGDRLAELRHDVDALARRMTEVERRLSADGRKTDSSLGGLLRASMRSLSGRPGRLGTGLMSPPEGRSSWRHPGRPARA